MSFVDSPIFTLISFGISLIALNLLPYLFGMEDKPYWKVWFPILVTTFFILEFIIVPWTMTNQFFLIFVVAFTFSYVHFCFTTKKRINTALYTVIFITLSILFIVWTTVMFGKYYFDNHLIDLLDYQSQYETILTANDWFPIMDLKLSIMYFDISFKTYFVLPDKISFENPAFVQFSLGIVISGTIISWVIDTIKDFVAPSKSN